MGVVLLCRLVVAAKTKDAWAENYAMVRRSHCGLGWMEKKRKQNFYYQKGRRLRSLDVTVIYSACDCAWSMLYSLVYSAP